MKKITLIITFICFTAKSLAQIHEAGIFLGGSNYIGDIGPEYYLNPNNVMGGFIYKWNKNPRIAFRGTFTLAEISSDDKDASNSARYQRGIGFNNTIKEIAVGMEFNFFEYDLSDARTTHTPYIILEAAAFNYKTITSQNPDGTFNYENKTSYAIPFGLGYKTKLFYNFALAFEVRARYTFEDNIDYNNFEIPELSFGNPSSNDWYILSGVSLVYTFGRPPCYSTPY